MSRLRMAMKRLEEAERELERHTQDIELQQESGFSLETEARLAELTAATEAIKAARALLGQLQSKEGSAA